MKNKNKIKSKGFTLLEVMISAAILIIVTGAAAASAVMAINSGTFSRNRTVAENLARGEIENLMVIRDNKGWEGNKPLGDDRYDKKKIDHQDFEISSVISLVDNDSNGETNVDEKANMRRVTTTVSWKEGFWGGKKEVKIVTYLTNHQ